MAEWLGNGLQNRVQQFDSAWYLKRKSPAKGLFLLRYQAEGAVSDRSFSLSTPPDLPVGEAWSLRSERGWACCGIVQIGRVPFFAIFVSDVEVIVLLNRFWDYD